MARKLLIVLLALAITLVSAGAARAAPENRDTFTATFDAGAGQLCDFAYHQEFTVNFSFKELPNGAYIEHDRLFVEHTNVETGYTLREQDRQNFIVNPSTATVKTVGSLLAPPRCHGKDGRRSGWSADIRSEHRRSDQGDSSRRSRLRCCHLSRAGRLAGFVTTAGAARAT